MAIQHCDMYSSGEGKVMQLRGLVGSTPLVRPQASSVSLAEERSFGRGYRLSLLSLKMSPPVLVKVEQCALFSFTATALDMGLECY